MSAHDPAASGEIVHVGQHDVRGVYLGYCSCGWEGADIFGHVDAALYGGRCPDCDNGSIWNPEAKGQVSACPRCGGSGHIGGGTDG